MIFPACIKVHRFLLYIHEWVEAHRRNLRTLRNLSTLSQEHVFQNEDNSEAAHEEADFFFLPADDIDDGVGNDTESDPFSDGVSERHSDDGEVAGDGFCHIIEIDACYSSEHQETNGDQGWCGCKSGDGHEEWREEQS